MRMRLPCSSNRLPALHRSSPQATVVGQPSCPAQARQVAKQGHCRGMRAACCFQRLAGVVGQGSLQCLGLLDCSSYLNQCMHAHCSMGVSGECPTSRCGTVVWDSVWQLAPSCNTAHLTMSVGVLR
jgi:hypothetical protein